MNIDEFKEQFPETIRQLGEGSIQECVDFLNSIQERHKVIDRAALIEHIFKKERIEGEINAR